MRAPLKYQAARSGGIPDKQTEGHSNNMNGTESTQPSVVAHTYNPGTWQVEKGESEVRSQLRLFETKRGSREGGKREKKERTKREGRERSQEGRGEHMSYQGQK